MDAVHIRLTQGGKKYSGQWVFRNLDLHLPAGDRLAILGPNGSGKSTLLQILAGAGLLNEGILDYSDSRKLEPDEIFRHVSLAAPYLELLEEFTLEESVRLHFSFKKPVNGCTLSQIISISGLTSAMHKPVRFFSSGMKQRLKLTLACLSETALLFLDEPCSNLDSEGVQWYKELVEQYGANRTIVICSNSHEEEYFVCRKTIRMTDYKNPVKQPVTG